MSTNPNMEAIETITVGATSVANITFSNIPQGYTDLVLNLSARVDAANGVAQLYFNGSTAVDKQWRRLYGDGSTATSDNSNGLSAYFRPIGINRSDQTASTFGNMSIYIPNYASTSTYKSMSADGVNENNATFAEAAFGAGLWQSNSAISSVTIIPSAGNFVQYSSATLYGITNAAVGAKATGGIISETDTHYIHTFIASGTFTPSQNLTADYLVVAGGGGGGRTDFGGYGVGAGGGGGGVKTATSQALTSNNNYTVTVGAGGSGGGGSAGSNGSSTIFSGTGITTLTATGGQTVGTSYAGGTSGADSSNAGGGGGPTSSGSTETYAGGGGGGSGGVGGSWNSSTTAGNGGAGTANAYSGSSVNYGGGGGGGYGRRTSSAATGTAGTGTDGGGNGTNANNTTGGAGTANRGGGGGGAGTLDAGSPTSGAGGSGIVIVRYAK